MKPSIGLAALVAPLAFLFLANTAHAEIAIAESIEWVVATSDRVVVGKVIKVTGPDKEDPPVDKKGFAGPDTKDPQVVTVAIAKTLKGEHADRVTFPVHRCIPLSFAKQWKEEGIPILFCLLENDGKRLPFTADRFPWVLREDGNGADAVLLGKSKHEWTGCIPVLTSNFQVLSRKEVILKYVEQVVKATGNARAKRSRTVDVPYSPVYRKLWSGSAVRLVVLDEQLPINAPEDDPVPDQAFFPARHFPDGLVTDRALYFTLGAACFFVLLLVLAIHRHRRKKREPSGEPIT
jgi:hypothetical protein